MSVSNLLVPNDYNIYCGSIDVDDQQLIETASPTFTFSGPWAPRVGIVKLARVGSLVTAVFDPVSAPATNAGQSILSDTLIPVSMRPSQAFTTCVVDVLDNANSAAAQFYINTDGTFRIFANINGGPFTVGAGPSGWNTRICVSWNTL